MLFASACGDPVDPCPGEECVEDLCEAVVCPIAEQSCEVVEGAAECRCPAGTVELDGACAPSTECTSATCEAGGICRLEDDGPVCECPDGYAGRFCETCAEGYLRNELGECDSNLCHPNPCDEPERASCSVVDGAAVCGCSPGFHEEMGVCVPDETCSPTTCGGRGECLDSEDGPSCVCEVGFGGRFCGSCDDEGGFHDDGMGGCTTDRCLPDPCTAPPLTRCVVVDEDVQCVCPVGTHLDGEDCVPDETCDATSCDGHGSCAIDGGRVLCTCDAGYAGAYCDECASGFHDDGMGGCTDDVCVPNPCADAGRGVCVEEDGAARCLCDPGLHEDGVGGCTDDPCLPHPCGTQACRRATDGSAECFTPVCDDGNPCTDDVPTMTGCDFLPLADGSPCSDTVCSSGQTCTASVCGGGTAVVCDDANPCTTSSCDAVTGCQFTVDDTLVPDDGVACTIDSCSGGTASHIDSDAACDDGLYCTGTERCAPSDPEASADGCLTENVPVAPAPSGCTSYGACDEASESFPPITRPAGATCDDGIACTLDDRCLTTGGACAGTPSASCGVIACDTTTPWSATVDIARANVTGAITLDGASPPTSAIDSRDRDGYIWAIARDTQVRHRIGRIDYHLNTSDLVTAAIDATLIPGVYDLLYERHEDLDSTGAGDRFVYRVDAGTTLPAGWRILRTDVVIPVGTSTLDVDIPRANVTGTITLDGAPPPASASDSRDRDGYIWAVAHDTEVRHRIGRIDYHLNTSDLVTAAIDATLLPGTYDLLYERHEDLDSNGAGDRFVYRVDAGTTLPAGWRVLRTDVVIPVGNSTLDVDIPRANVTGAITLDGAPPPASAIDSRDRDGYVWAVAHDTEVRHRIGRIDYHLNTSDLVTAAIDATLVPGTYDLLYERHEDLDSTGAGDRFVYRVDAGTTLPAGWRVLRTDVVIPAGSSTLDVDIPRANVTGAITLDGSPPPASAIDSRDRDGYIWAIAHDTRVRHRIGRIDYHLNTSDLVTAAIDATLLPGTYDLLYERHEDLDSTGAGDRFVYRVDAGTTLPAGWRILRTDVVIPVGTSTLDVDIPRANVTGAITLDGSPPPSSAIDSRDRDGYIWAVAHDTRVRHRIGRIDYHLNTSDLVTAAIDATLLPGTYDLLYERHEDLDSTGAGDRFVYRVDAGTTLPAGWRILRTDVVIPTGSSTLNVDIPRANLTGAITLDGAAPPMSAIDSRDRDGYIWAISRDTRVRHRIGRVDYHLNTSELVTAAIDATLLPGTYDLLYERHEDLDPNGAGDRFVYQVDAGTTLPAGWRILAQCVQLE